jgi:hypothetical protein
MSKCELCGEPMPCDRNRGLYSRFNVTRTDGSSAPGGKHCGCVYFVLDLTHDKHAAAALRAYVESCAAEYPLLAADLLAGIKARDTASRQAAAASWLV